MSSASRSGSHSATADSANADPMKATPLLCSALDLSSSPDPTNSCPWLPTQVRERSKEAAGKGLGMQRKGRV